jgi:hypothetical protein
MLNKILQIAGVQSQEERDLKLYNDLIKHEARVGGKLFGAVPKGHRREFFCMDEHTWIYHEEWQDKNGKNKSRTTRYEVRPDCVVKISTSGKYQKISNAEAARFYDAVLAYEKNVKREVYRTA